MVAHRGNCLHLDHLSSPLSAVDCDLLPLPTATEVRRPPFSLVGGQPLLMHYHIGPLHLEDEQWQSLPCSSYRHLIVGTGAELLDPRWIVAGWWIAPAPNYAVATTGWWFEQLRNQSESVLSWQSRRTQALWLLLALVWPCVAEISFHYMTQLVVEVRFSNELVATSYSFSILLWVIGCYWDPLSPNNTWLCHFIASPDVVLFSSTPMLAAIWAVFSK